MTDPSTISPALDDRCRCAAPGAIGEPPERRWRWLTVSAAVVSLAAVGVWMVLAASSFMIDLRVFQDAGVAWSRRLPLYSEDFATSTGLRFIWATEFFITDRAGAHAFHRNQAITGALARAGLDGVAKDLVWLLLATAVIVAGVYAISRFQRAGGVVPTIGVAALVTLLIAPIAVTHHWVYGIALLPVLIAPRYRRWRPMVAVAAAALILGPHTVLTAPAINSSEGAIPLTIVGNAQLLTAVMLLICAVVAARRCAPTPPAPASPVLADQHRQQHEGGPVPRSPLSGVVGGHR